MPNHKDLPLTATHWGAYRVKTENGKVTALYGFEQDEDPSPIGQGMIDAIDAPSRVRRPMVRKSWLDAGPGSKNSARGADPFVAVSWQRAEKLVANELDRVRNSFGNQAIYGGSYGWSSAGRFHHAQSQLHRFLNCIGGYTSSVNTYSFAAAEVVVPYVLGDFWSHIWRATSWHSIIGNTELFVAFGGVPLRNGQVNAGGVGNHRQRLSIAAALETGTKFVNISPLRSDMDAAIDAQWLALRPNTDTAVLLAIAHTLLAEGLHDRDFVDRYTSGLDKFSAYLKGETDATPKSAEWAAAICGLSANEIRSLARQMAAARTMISVSWSLTRQDHGEQTYWAAIAVAALLGQIGLPGGGIGLGYSAMNSVGDQGEIVPGADFPQGENPVADYIPVARISDMLLNPGKSFDYNGEVLTYPDIRLIYWAGGNPFHHHQNLNRFARAWQKPDTIIVNDWCWNSLARHADIVLPCTTPLERSDIVLSPHDPYLMATQKVIEPIGQCRDDFDIFCGIAKHMDLPTDFDGGRSKADWLRHIYDTTLERAVGAGIELPPYQQLRETGWTKVKAPAEPRVMLKAFRENPDLNPLPTPSGRIEFYSEKVAGFGYEDCPGFPFWVEPEEWLGLHMPKYRLHLISKQPSTKLHAQYDQGALSRSAKIRGREPILLHPDDAQSRGIRPGDIVRVFNDRGACLAGAVIDEGIRPGVVQMSTGAWYDPLHPGVPGSLCKHGNVNVLTIDRGTSRLAQGPMANTCLVEVEPSTGEIPAVTAFEPPEIIDRM
ncbi:molybdopterin-dependent oxidoreductase [Hoeflea sp. TYP-13]|uniref:molybdopterin-dependent oxidoreductase n=1 Tax=Hoeflea sp. TYP-13 TaxID=3230023 RepID=UPI0034C6020E